MKNLKHILLFIPLLFMFSACKKLDDNNADKLVGKWKFLYTTNAKNEIFYPNSINQNDDFTIEFKKQGRIEMIDHGSESNYTIRDYYPYESAQYAYASNWDLFVSFYGNNEGRKSITLYYFSDDSIGINNYPFYFEDININPYANNYLNIFHRVE